MLSLIKYIKHSINKRQKQKKIQTNKKFPIPHRDKADPFDFAHIHFVNNIFILTQYVSAIMLQSQQFLRVEYSKCQSLKNRTTHPETQRSQSKLW